MASKAEEKTVVIQPVQMRGSLKEALRHVKLELISINRAVKAGVKPKIKRNYWLISEPGAGKTQSIQCIGEDIKKEFGVDIDVAIKCVPCDQLERGEINGIPVPVSTRPDGKLDSISKLMMDYILPPPPKDEKEAKDPNLAYNKPGILFLDEITSMDWSTRTELLTLCGTPLQKTTGEMKKVYPIIPPSWIVIAAGNTMDTIQEGTTTFGYNVKNRFQVWFVKPDFKDWKKWAMDWVEEETGRKGIHPLIMAYLEDKPDNLQIDTTEDIRMNEGATTPNPRQWEKLNASIYDADYYLECGIFKSVDEYLDYIREEAFTLIGSLTDDFMIYIENKQDMIPPELLSTEDFSKAPAKYKNYKGLSNQLKLLSIYTTLSNIAGDDQIMKDTKLAQKAYKNVLNNTDFIYDNSSVEVLTSIIDTVRSRFPELKISELKESLQSAAIKANLFEKGEL